MANVTQQYVVANGYRNYITDWTFFSDGSGDEAGAVKVDPTSGGNPSLGVTIAGNTVYPTTSLKVKRIVCHAQGLTVRFQWDCTTDQDFWMVSDTWDEADWGPMGCLACPAAAAGSTGKILVTTAGAMINSSYSFTIWCVKAIQF